MPQCFLPKNLTSGTSYQIVFNEIQAANKKLDEIKRKQNKFALKNTNNFSNKSKCK